MSSWSLFKALLGGMTTLWFFWLVLVTLESGATQRGQTQAAVVGVFKREQVVGSSDKLVYNPKLDHNYMMSKRRVPNGPDPIHNRRAGNSKRPPGRA